MTCGVPYLNAAELLLSAKAWQPVYHRTDTHWNAHGALIIYRAVMARLKAENPALAYETYENVMWQEQMHTGDLMRMWLPVGAEEESVTVPEITRAYRTKGPMRSVSDVVIQTESGQNTLRMCFIRDSFGDALFPYFANNIGSLTFTRLAPADALAAYAGDADIVVLEIAERNLSTLLSLHSAEN